jgi:hypothetical protein
MMNWQILGWTRLHFYNAGCFSHLDNSFKDKTCLPRTDSGNNLIFYVVVTVVASGC